MVGANGVSILPHEKFGPNDHRKDAPHFNLDHTLSNKRGFSGIEQLYFDISLDLDTAPQNRQEIFQQKLTQLLSTGEYLLRIVDNSPDYTV